MTIAGKINALVLVITAFLGVLATGFMAVREFRIERDLAIDRTVALASNLPQLQVDIYFQDTAGLDRSLDHFLEPPPVSYVVLYDAGGKLLSQRSRAGAAPSDLPPFTL
ncbi:MAG: hypothetical protein OEV88_16235, partial [Gammaproteobacteria bacterium]|nr:hypothetical protein [Gammaproteobacteria bacterium]